MKLVTFALYSEGLEPEKVEGVQDDVVPHHLELLRAHLFDPLQGQEHYIFKFSKELDQRISTYFLPIGTFSGLMFTLLKSPKKSSQGDMR